MAKSIEDLLNSLIIPNNDEIGNKFSPREIWDMIANKESFDAMGFSSEEDLEKWIEDNPYENI